MKRKISIAFLIAIITTMMSLCTLATTDNLLRVYGETEIPDPNQIQNDMLISPKPVEYNTIKVQLDGEYLDFTDAEGNTVNPTMMNNRTMVPMRKIFEEFGMQIEWSPSARTITAMNDDKIISLAIDSTIATIEDRENSQKETIELDAAPVILDNRTMVPVRFIAESLEKEVAWDANNRTVIIIDFDKVTKELEEKVPQLKEMFELEVDPVESLKTTSKVTGEITYKDPEDKANNETIKIDGTLDLNMNKEKELELVLDLTFSGKGELYKSIEETGYKNFKFAMVMADGNTYIMILQDGKEVWEELGEVIDLSAFDSLNSISSPKSYEEYVDALKLGLGELDSSSYMVLEQLINLMSKIYNENNFKITGTAAKKTITMNVDLKDIVGDLLQETEILKDAKFEMAVVEKIANKKVENVKIDYEIYFQEPTTKESVEMNFKLDMNVNSMNKDFDIKLPEVEF